MPDPRVVHVPRRWRLLVVVLILAVIAAPGIIGQALASAGPLCRYECATPGPMFCAPQCPSPSVVPSASPSVSPEAVSLPGLPPTGRAVQNRIPKETP